MILAMPAASIARRFSFLINYKNYILNLMNKLYSRFYLISLRIRLSKKFLHKGRYIKNLIGCKGMLNCPNLSHKPKVLFYRSLSFMGISIFLISLNCRFPVYADPRSTGGRHLYLYLLVSIVVNDTMHDNNERSVAKFIPGQRGSLIGR